MKITMIMTRLTEVKITKTLEFFIRNDKEVTAEQHDKLLHYLYKWLVLNSENASFSLYISLEDNTTVFMYKKDISGGTFLQYFISMDKDVVYTDVELSCSKLMEDVYKTLRMFDETKGGK